MTQDAALKQQPVKIAPRYFRDQEVGGEIGGAEARGRASDTAQPPAGTPEKAQIAGALSRCFIFELQLSLKV
ncbi:MAG: hypothetical protein ACTSU5_03545 [Promethearchaeota archaeon]